MRLFGVWLVGLLLPAVEMRGVGGRVGVGGGVGGCPSGWKSNGNYCFFFSSNSATWVEARAQCAAMGASLAKPANDVENRFFGNNVNFLLTWIAATRSGGAFVNGDSVRVSHYNNDDSDRESEAFVTYFMYPRQWRNADCNNRYGYICERTMTEGACPPNSLPIGSRCFILELHAKIPRDAAAAECEQAGGTLAKIDSEGVRDGLFGIFKALANGTSVDVNSNLNLSMRLWIGAKRSSEGNSFSWGSDDGPLAFGDWLPGYPDSASGDCAAVFPSKWSTVDAGSGSGIVRRMGYVCRRAVGVSAFVDVVASLYQTLVDFFLRSSYYILDNLRLHF